MGGQCRCRRDRRRSVGAHWRRHRRRSSSASQRAGRGHDTRDQPLVSNVRHAAQLRIARRGAGTRGRCAQRIDRPSLSEEFVLADLQEAAAAPAGDHRPADDRRSAARTSSRASASASSDAAMGGQGWRRCVTGSMVRVDGAMAPPPTGSNVLCVGYAGAFVRLRLNHIDTIMKFDVIVVGSGHAGVEAAWAAAQLGCSVGLCTLTRETIALMPCNPAVGGTAKGHLVKEIDALGGLMGRAIDATGMQFKMLNRSRGPGRVVTAGAGRQAAVRRVGPRASSKHNPASSGCWAAPASVHHASTAVSPVWRSKTAANSAAKSLVITTGTFLNGLVHVGREQRPAGRAGEPPSRRSRGVAQVVRLRVGTAEDRHAAAAGAPVDRFRRRRGGAACSTWNMATPSPSPFSYLADERPTNQIVCHLLHTTDEVHRLVRREHRRVAALQRPDCRNRPAVLPVARGQGHAVSRIGNGTRFFSSRKGWTSRRFYVNGFSMSLPAEIQERLVRALPGLEAAEMLRPGYAVEYDFIQPTELRRDAGNAAGWPGCSSRGRSTARPATRRRQGRAWWPGSTPRCGRFDGRRWCWGATRPTSAS